MACKSCGSGWHTVEQVAHGALGLAKVVAGMRVDDEVQAARLMQCKGCVHLVRFVKGIDAMADVGLADRCEACGCFVRAKSLIEREVCPHGRW